MKYFSLTEALKDGFYFLSETARKSTIIWAVFFVLLCLTIVNQFMMQPVIEQFVNFYMGFVESAFISSPAMPALPKINGLIFVYSFCISLASSYLACLVTKSAILLIRYPDYVVTKDSLRVSFKVFLNFLWVSILFSLLLAAGYICLIIPALIWGMTYLFSRYFLIEKEKGTIYSFSMSRRLTSGIRWKLFFSMLLVGALTAIFSMIFVSVLMNYHTVSTIVTCFVTTFISYYMAFFLASIYRQLIENYKEDPSIDPEFVENYFIVRHINNEEALLKNEL